MAKGTKLAKTTKACSKKSGACAGSDMSNYSTKDCGCGCGEKKSGTKSKKGE